MAFLFLPLCPGPSISVLVLTNVGYWGFSSLLDVTWRYCSPGNGRYQRSSVLVEGLQTSPFLFEEELFAYLFSCWRDSKCGIFDSFRLSNFDVFVENLCLVVLRIALISPTVGCRLFLRTTDGFCIQFLLWARIYVTGAHHLTLAI